MSQVSCPGRRLVLAGLALIAATVAGEAQEPAAGPASPSFFNSQETRSDSLAPFKKWTAALSRFTEAEAKEKAGGCDEKKFNKCHYAEWVKFLESVRGKDKLTQLKEVNKYLNQATYITDNVNWGEEDYWATPFEFFAKFGDCEDYAISKFMSLRYLGFDPGALRVVAVKDMNLKVGHAILAAFVDGKVFILDNQVKIVVEAEKIRHYQPVFSINEKSWWRHRV